MGKYDYLVGNTAPSPQKSKYDYLVPEKSQPAAEPIKQKSGVIGGIQTIANDVKNVVTAPFPKQSFNPIEALKTGANVIKNTFNDQVARLEKGHKVMTDPNASVLEKTAAQAEINLGWVNAAFTPITATLQGATKLPVVGSAAEIINRFFGTLGTVGSDISEGAVNALPVSPETKKTILPVSKEIGALVAQLVVGGKGGKETLTKAGLLKQKVTEVAEHIDKDVSYQVKVASESEPTTIRVRTPDIKHEEYARSVGYEPYAPIESLPIIKLGPKAPDNLPVIQTVPKESKVAGDLTIEPIKPEILQPEAKTTPISTEVPPRKTDTSGSFREDQYLYHGTSQSALEHIKNEGIRPQRRGVSSFSRSEDYSKHWAFPEATNTKGVMFRVKASLLKDKTVTTTKPRPASDQLHEVLTKETIPPEVIEIYKNGTWQPLKPSPAIPKETTQGGEQVPNTRAQTLERAAVEKKLTDTLGTLPTHEKLDMAEQARLATEYINTSPKEALAVARGDSRSPQGILPEAIYTALEIKAIKDGDMSLMKELSRSKLPTEAGQSLKALDSADPNSPVKIIRDIEQAREKAAEKRLGKKKEAAVKDVVKDIKDEVTKSVSKRPDWDSFLREIQCK